MRKEGRGQDDKPPMGPWPATASGELGREAFGALLGAYRRGISADGAAEHEEWRRHLRPLSLAWDQVFPGFPSQPSYASYGGVRRRGQRDVYLKDLIVRLLQQPGAPARRRVVVNPACVFGRHARDLASRMKEVDVVGSDIFPVCNWIYGCLSGRGALPNYQFQKDDIFRPRIRSSPWAVIFFGACGSLSDAAMEYAITAGAPYLMCRTCCHDNIGGNTVIEKSRTVLNRLFRIKNLAFRMVRLTLPGHYFSSAYGLDRYPLSQAARVQCGAGEVLDWARYSVDSDLCRTLIDLDRYMRLVENGYRVWYRGELFVALKGHILTEGQLMGTYQRKP